MLGNFIYSEDMPAGYAAPQKLEKAVKRFLLLAVIFISGGLIWIFAISPCMVPARIDVKGFPGISKQDVLNIAGISGGAAYVSINPQEVEWLLSRYYPIESAKVIKRFPDRLSVFLEPRRPVAVVLADVDGKIQPVCFDRFGVAFKIANELTDASISALPLISGIFPENQPLRLGMKLPSAYLSLLSRISAIGSEDPKLWYAISQIQIHKKNNDMFDLVLYPVHDSIRLRMGSDINKDSIYYALLISDVCRQLGDAPDEIDVRSGLGAMIKETRFGK